MNAMFYSPLVLDGETLRSMKKDPNYAGWADVGLDDKLRTAVGESYDCCLKLAQDMRKAVDDVHRQLERFDIIAEYQLEWEFGSPSVSVNLDPVEWSISPVKAPEFPLESTTTGSPQTFLLANHWLGECEKHATCRQPVPGVSKPPARLVHIQETNGTLQARLTQDIVPTTRYATLSHRWSSEPTLRLLQSNLDQFQTEIPISKLEQVFQDAILTSHTLGLCLLWIDSLCIIQDSPGDWESQSSIMGSIYKNAFCNIAAASGPDGDRGLFTTRDPFSHYTPHILLNWDAFSPPEYPDHDPIALGGYYTLRDSAHWGVNVTSAPLNTRGWVAQERDLSPCILTFGRHQVFWKCTDLMACESFPSGIPGMSTYQMSYNTRSFRDLVKAYTSDDEVFRYWLGFVNRYSRTQLTRQRDRLPAAFGMAMELARLMPSQRFTAGLWSGYLIEGLLWRSDEFVEERRPMNLLTDFGVPSWSWASVDGAVISDAWRTLGEFESLVEVGEDGMVGGEGNAFVGCNRLKILVKRRMIRVGDAMANVTVGTTGQGKPFRVYPDDLEQRVGDGLLADEGGSFGMAGRTVGGDTVMLPMIQFVHYDIVMGLLVNSRGLAEGVFSRVGFFEAWFEDEKQLGDAFGGTTKIEDGEVAGSEGSRSWIFLV
ncbi:hypothetical protein OQA88_2066 [Cercophora sp. LCS_1]